LVELVETSDGRSSEVIAFSRSARRISTSSITGVGSPDLDKLDHRGRLAGSRRARSPGSACRISTRLVAGRPTGGFRTSL